MVSVSGGHSRMTERPMRPSRSRGGSGFFGGGAQNGGKQLGGRIFVFHNRLAGQAACDRTPVRGREGPRGRRGQHTEGRQPQQTIRKKADVLTITQGWLTLFLHIMYTDTQARRKRIAEHTGNLQIRSNLGVSVKRAPLACQAALTSALRRSAVSWAISASTVGCSMPSITIAS